MVNQYNSAGYGSGTTMYPCLMPLLSTIQLDVAESYGSAIEFYDKFLSSIWSGRAAVLKGTLYLVSVFRIKYQQ